MIDYKQMADEYTALSEKADARDVAIYKNLTSVSGGLRCEIETYPLQSKMRLLRLEADLHVDYSDPNTINNAFTKAVKKCDEKSRVLYQKHRDEFLKELREMADLIRANYTPEQKAQLNKDKEERRARNEKSAEIDANLRKATDALIKRQYTQKM